VAATVGARRAEATELRPVYQTSGNLYKLKVGAKGLALRYMVLRRARPALFAHGGGLTMSFKSTGALGWRSANAQPQVNR
jgi:hypothetical protein